MQLSPAQFQIQLLVKPDSGKIMINTCFGKIPTQTRQEKNWDQLISLCVQKYKVVKCSTMAKCLVPVNKQPFKSSQFNFIYIAYLNDIECWPKC